MRHRVGGHDRLRPSMDVYDWTTALPRFEGASKVPSTNEPLLLARVRPQCHTVPASFNFAGVAFLGSESSPDRAKRLRNLLETTCR